MHKCFTFSCTFFGCEQVFVSVSLFKFYFFHMGINLSYQFEIRLCIQKCQNDQMIRTTTRTWILTRSKPHSLFLFLKYKNAKKSIAHIHTDAYRQWNRYALPNRTFHQIHCSLFQSHCTHYTKICYVEQEQPSNFEVFMEMPKLIDKNWNVSVCVLARVLHFGHGFCVFFSLSLIVFCYVAEAKVQETIEARTYLFTLLQ